MLDCRRFYPQKQYNVFDQHYYKVMLAIQQLLNRRKNLTASPQEWKSNKAKTHTSHYEKMAR
jgi:hypothetical protein